MHNSTNFHVSVNQTNGFTAWGVHLLTPTTKGMDARNTDGIDPGSSTNVTVAHSWIDNGDDNIAIKAGTTHMSVLDNHFYSGHGMSIDFSATDIKVVPAKPALSDTAAKESAFTCDGKFVPMQ